MIRALRVAAVVLAAGAGLVAGVAPPAGAAEGSFRFAANEVQASEGQAYVQIVVERLDLPVSRATVEFRTEPGSARPGPDYTEAAGTLLFEVGDTNRAFTVLLRDDDVPEEREYVGLRLSRGAALLALGRLAVVDDDQRAAPATTGTVEGGPAPRPSAVAPAPPPAPVAAAPAPTVAPSAPQVVSSRPRPRARTVPPRRVTVRQSPVTPFELRPAAPGPSSTGPLGTPGAVDPGVAVLAGLLLARVAAEVWFRLRTLAA